MQATILPELLLWFFALAGFAVLLNDVVRYFMYKNTVPAQMSVLIPASSVSEKARVGIANLLNLLYEQNPHGQYELIILDNGETGDILKQIAPLADTAESVYVANSANVAEYIKQSFQ